MSPMQQDFQILQSKDRRPGWDQKLDSAIMRVFGDGNASLGRERLRRMAVGLVMEHPDSK
jgi:hypothetical protein